MQEKVIFLDIDGPMIPNTSFLFDRFASFGQNLDERCVRVLKLILDRSSAKIVFNTTHNTALYPTKHKKEKYNSPGLLGKFEEVGIGAEYLHSDFFTKYPHIGNRLEAIKEWLSRNHSDNMLWVALDDVKINHKRAFLVNPDHGIGIDAFNHCAKYLMFKNMIVL